MRATRFCFVLLVAGLLAAACASSSAAPTSNYYDKPGGAGAATQGPLFPGSSQAGNGKVVPEPTSAAGASVRAAAPESQIIKTGTVTVQVAALDSSITLATDQMHALGGWLAGSQRTEDVAGAMASVTFRIPVNQFETALAAMRKLGTKVLGEHTESTPVGGQIIDLQARIANLRASERAIQAIMAKATTIGDVLTVQQRLAEVQGQIEELSGQLAGLTDQSAYSTLTVDFVVPWTPGSPSPTPSPSPSPTEIPWSAGDQAGQAAGVLGDVGKGAATLIIWAVILIVPVALITVLLLALLGFLGRRIDPYRKRLLPFTVSQPGSYRQPPMPYGVQYPPTPPAPQAPTGPRPEDRPKV